MRKKLKIDQLAKLRQFTPGMDVEKFLSSEFRQIVRAIEQSGIDLDDYLTAEQVQNAISSPSTGKSDLYATNGSSFAVGVVPLLNRVLNSGEIVSNRFYPSSAGKYWVDFGMQMVPGIAGTVTNDLVLKNTSGATINTLSVRVETTIGGPKYVTGRSFIDLTQAVGAYFDFTGDVNTVGFNFYCSFTKVS